MKLGLGTVQFGLDYGISNSRGKTKAQEVRKIFSLAQEKGIRVIDTAHGYGESEAIIGACLPSEHSFRIFTKTPPFRKQSLKKEDIELARRAFESSLLNLKQEKLAGIFVHHAKDLCVPGGEMLFRYLEDLKESGVVDKIGVSVYGQEEIDFLWDKFSLDIIQVPVNVFDQRLIETGHLGKLKARGVEIHARSIFLQGLLLMDQLDAHFSPWQSHIQKWRDFLKTNDWSKIQGPIEFICQQEEIDFAILGVNDQLQLEENFGCFRKSSPSQYHFKTFAQTDEKLLNPSLWKLSS